MRHVIVRYTVKPGQEQSARSWCRRSTTSCTRPSPPGCGMPRSGSTRPDLRPRRLRRNPRPPQPDAGGSGLPAIHRRHRRPLREPPGVPGGPDHSGAHEATAGWRGDGPSRQSPGWSCSLLCAGWSFRGRRRQWPAAQGRAWTARRADRRSAIAGPGAVEAVTTQAQSQPRWRPSGQVRLRDPATGRQPARIAGLANHEQAGTRAIAIGAAKWSIAWRDPGRPNWLICAGSALPPEHAEPHVFGVISPSVASTNPSPTVAVGVYLAGWPGHPWRKVCAAGGFVP